MSAVVSALGRIGIMKLAQGGKSLRAGPAFKQIIYGFGHPQFFCHPKYRDICLIKHIFCVVKPHIANGRKITVFNSRCL